MSAHTPAGHTYIGICQECDKRLYDSRKLARQALHRNHPGEHKHAYPCPTTPGFWHIGKKQYRQQRGEYAEAYETLPAAAKAGIARVHAAATRKANDG